MITIRAVTTDNRTIEWNYDHASQCANLWKAIVSKGRAPDTGDSLIRAYYFAHRCNPGDGPTKAWMA